VDRDNVNLLLRAFTFGGSKLIYITVVLHLFYSRTIKIRI